MMVYSPYCDGKAVRTNQLLFLNKLNYQHKVGPVSWTILNSVFTISFLLNVPTHNNKRQHHNIHVFKSDTSKIVKQSTNIDY